jgi:ubiquinone/menaquinone biosynthesis C-methylase UbiE
MESAPFRKSTMSTSSSSEAECARIKEVYRRREIGIPKDRYSLFKKENLLVHLDLQFEILSLLKKFSRTSLETERILDVGCGRAYWLRQMIQWGAKPENLFGIDLMPDRLQDARNLCPSQVTLECGDASYLAFRDAEFTLVLQFTVFTSILDDGMKKNLAAEIARVLKPGGAVLWYDYFVSNPRNPDVRGVARREIGRLFPGFSIFLKRVTLAPPIARTVGPISSSLYRLFSSVRPLRTHYLGILQKQ